MNDRMRLAVASLTELLESHQTTAGTYVRVHGDHLIIGRQESDPDGNAYRDDRVRLTNLGASIWGLSVKRHTGRWERTPFHGPMNEMVETIQTFMQHLVARL
jgi:hypothetical protein